MPQLINDSGRPDFGFHDGPVSEFNTAALKKYGKDTLLKSPLFKQWVFTGVSNKDIIFGLAIVSLGYIADAFSYLFDRKTKTLVVQADKTALFGMGVKFTGSAAAGSAIFKSPGITAGVHITPSEIKAGSNFGDGFEANLIFSRLKKPLSLTTRNGLEGFNYTNKEAGLSVTGTIKAKGRQYIVDPKAPSGIFDYTFGLPRHETFWNWASGCGIDSKGKKIGFNFAQGINETGFTENVFWIDGAPVKMDTVNFIYDGRNLTAPWRIKSADGKADLVFTPEGKRAKNLNLGFIRSYFYQPFGSFAGTLENKGVKYKIIQAHGFTEEHLAKW